MFLGENLLPLLTLAIGGALAVGTIGAFIRPRTDVRDGELERPPVGRSIVQGRHRRHRVYLGHRLPARLMVLG